MSFEALIAGDPVEYLWQRVDQMHHTVLADYQRAKPVPVGRLAHDLGLLVQSRTLDPNISGSIRPEESAPSGFLIEVNNIDVDVRQRFTVAHEIAHFLVHRTAIGDGVTDTILYRSNLSSRQEVEANKLASAILMPIRLLEKWKADQAEAEVSETKLERIAFAFKVSTLAAGFRMSA